VILEKYKLWQEKAVADSDLVTELKNMSETDIEDAFYMDLDNKSNCFLFKVCAYLPSIL